MSKKLPKISLAPKIEPRTGDIERLFATENDIEQASGWQLLALRLDSLEPDPAQPRQTILAERLQELSDSILQDGVIQPIEVTEMSPGRYKIVHGERRWRAAQLAGLATIPAIVRRRDYDNLTRFVRQLIENIQREDLNDVDRAAGLLKLKELMQEAEGQPPDQPQTAKVTWAKVGKRLGYSRQRIHQLIQLLNLPEEIKEAVRQGELSERETRVYQGLKLTQQRDLHEARQKEELSPNEVSQVARRLKEEPTRTVSQVMRDVRSEEAPQPIWVERTTLAPRRNTQNLNRLQWARDHLSRIQLPPNLSQEERQELNHLLKLLEQDVTSLMAALQQP